MAPPPKPAIDRKANNMAAFCANPAHRFAHARIPMHVSNNGFRPTMSLNRPLMSWTLVLASKKLVATHEMDGPMLRAAPIAGTAVETEVWSR